MNEKTRKLTLMAMLGALAYLVMLIGRIPVVLFLSYDPKDIVIATGAFLLGPLAGAAISLTGLAGRDGHRQRHGLHRLLHERAVHLRVRAARRVDLQAPPHAPGRGCSAWRAGVACMVAVMIAWNYIVTPLYMTSVTRAAVAEAADSHAFLPFNLLKAALNAGLTMLLYKPVSQALARAHLLPRASTADAAHPARRFNPVATLTSAFVVVTAVLCFWFLSRG